MHGSLHIIYATEADRSRRETAARNRRAASLRRPFGSIRARVSARRAAAPASPAALPRERNPPLSVAHTPRPCAAGDRPPPARAPHAAGREPHAAPALPRRAPLWGFPHLSAARRSATMTDVTRRVTSPVFVGRDAELEALDAALARAAGGRAGVRVHRRRVGRRQDAAARRARIARACARDARAARPVPRARRRPDPLRAARRRAAPARARPRRRRGRGPARGHAQRARRAAARARRHRHARRTTSRAPARAGCSRRCSACSTSSAAASRCCSRSRTCTGPTASTRDFITFLVRSAREERVCLDRHLPLRRAAPPPPAAPAARRARARVGRRADRARALRAAPRSPSSSRGSSRSRRRPARSPTACYGRSQGNPLYTEELLAASEEGDGWLLPETLRDVLLARVERLSPTAQAVVRDRRRARPPDHARAARGGRRPVAGRGDGGRARGGRQPGARDRRRRPLRVPPRAGRRGGARRPAPRRGHRRCTRGIARRSRRDPTLLGDVAASTVAAELACHWQSAHELDRSLGALRARRGRRQALYAYEEARRHFERALELWARVPDAEAHRRDRPGRAAAADARRAPSARGEGSRAVALIREALAALDADADPLRAAGALRARRQLPPRRRRRGGELRRVRPRGRAAARAPERRARPGAADPRRASRCCSAISARRARPRPAPSTRRARSATERIEVQALNTLGFSRAGLGESRRGHRDAARGPPYGRAPRPADESRAAVNLSEALDLAGRTEEALEVVQRRGRHARRAARALDASTRSSTIQQAYLLLRLGRLSEARARCRGASRARRSPTPGCSGARRARGSRC